MRDLVDPERGSSVGRGLTHFAHGLGQPSVISSDIFGPTSPLPNPRHGMNHNYLVYLSSTWL